MKYKLMISDYDGTLGRAPKNDVDSETLKAINKFIEQGGIFTVCTGRETSSILKICKSQGLKGLLVSFQGAKISDIESGKILFNGGLEKEKALEVLELMKDSGLTALGYGETDIFYDEFNDYINYYQNAVRLPGRVANVKQEILNSCIGVSKICFLGAEEIVKAQEVRLNKIFNGNGVKFNSGARCLLEAINPKCGKGFAVRFLADYYKIPLDEIITVGDSTNDIDLICGEWHGVAVGDGRDELKAVAKEITVPFREKPVKTLLEKYCLD